MVRMFAVAGGLTNPRMYGSIRRPYRIEKLLDKIRSTGRGGISADDDLAVEKLTKKLEGMESQQTMMKAVNAYFRKHAECPYRI